MATEITERKVKEWIDINLFDEIKEADNTHPDVEFQCAVLKHGSELAANLQKQKKDNVLTIVCILPIDADLLATLLDLDRERRDLNLHLSHVFTSIPGTWDYIDENNNTMADFTEARAIRFIDRIFPDGFTQQRLIDRITALLGGIIFIDEAFDATRKNIQDRT